MQDSSRVMYSWHRIFDQREPRNLVNLSRQTPLLRERLIVPLSGGVDSVVMEARPAAFAVLTEVAG